MDFIMASSFFGPLLSVILLGSIIYDGWRHFYFIYPAFIFLGLVGLEAIISFIKNNFKSRQFYLTIAITAIFLTSITTTSIFMIKNHPYQNLYFNFWVGGIGNAFKNFEMDYWGLTFREGLEYIASKDKDPVIPIYFARDNPHNIDILAPDIKARFKVFLSPDKVKYVLSNYRWQDTTVLPHDKEFYNVMVQGFPVMTIFKMY